MPGIFAEFERAMIVERVTSGIARARERGTKSGRPIGGQRLPPAKVDAVRAALAAESSIRARAAGVSIGKAHAVSRSI
jgi:DNA invertase Pin-like site-specific DNA recombinase